MRSTLRVLRMLVSGKQCHNTVSHSRLHTASYANNMTTLGGAQDINEPGLASRLRLAVVRLNRRLRAQRDVEAVATLTQLSAMASLHRHGPMSPRELAERERVQPPSMTRVIAALVEGGFIDRSPHPTDGRQTVVALTETGRRYVDAQVSARERWLDARLAELTADERAVLCRAAEIIDRMAST
jgi:DNA-binding MarR family transcriptional regulator